MSPGSIAQGSPANGAAQVVVELAVDAEVEALSGAGLADGEGAAALEAFLLEQRRREADVGQARHDGRGAVEVRRTRHRGNDGGRNVLEHSTKRICFGILARDKGSGSKGPCLVRLQ